MITATQLFHPRAFRWTRYVQTPKTTPQKQHLAAAARLRMQDQKVPASTGSPQAGTSGALGFAQEMRNSEARVGVEPYGTGLGNFEFQIVLS